jgi:hypothetical protein
VYAAWAEIAARPESKVRQLNISNINKFRCFIVPPFQKNEMR